MYVEDDYIKEQFIKNFIQSSSKNIVIYGVGVHTQRLLENIYDDRIVGLMDAKTTGETMWGKKVLSYDEVAAIPDVTIVILARNAVINVIYRRIEKFVKQNGISVYDINGNDLCAVTIENKEHPCFCLSEQELLYKVEKAKVVTFDIFDTLISRWVQRPRDIFKLIDEELVDSTYKFSDARINVEDKKNVGTNATINQIYDRLQEMLVLSDCDRDRLFELELNIEKKYLHRREYMCQILDKLVQEGKKVYLISDMYFTKDILVDILESMDIRGFLDIYVSCEYKKTKEQGLFNEFLAITGYNPEDCLHIGDNYYADILSPKKLGIETFQIYGPVEMLENSIYSVALDKCNSLEENIVLARFAVDAFNNPLGKYNKNGKLILDSVEQVAKLFVAPVIYKYSIWLVQQLKKNENDFVLFPSRDGYILQNIYEMISKMFSSLKLPKSRYFYTSRRAALAASVKNPEDILHILEISDSRSLAEIIKQRFEIDVDGDISKSDISEELLKEILDRASVENENYMNYIKNTGFYNYNKVAFVDFVAMGTIQKALQKITETEIQGYYFLKRSSDKGLVDEFAFNSLYEVVGDFQADANIYKYYYFLESVVTSYEGSVKFVTADGMPEFFDDNRDDKILDMLKKIHLCIYQYCEQMMSAHSNILQRCSDVGLYDTLLGFFSADCSDITDEGICHIVNIDEFMGKTVTDINR